MSRDRSRTSVVLEGRTLAGLRLKDRRIVIRGGRLAVSEEDAPIWRLGPEKIVFGGFHDHHTHLVGTFRPLAGPGLEGAASREECLDRLRRWLRENPGTTPVLGEGWDESGWEEPRPPKGTDLDAISPGRPVALRRVCGHLAVANRAAWRDLEPAGPDADAATGTLFESLAMGLPRRWPPPPEAYLDGVRRAQEAAHRMGVLGADEMGRAEGHAAFRSFAEAGRLELTIRHFFPIESWPDQLPPGSGFGDRVGALAITGVKGFLDGSIGARTAAMEPGFIDRDATGALLWGLDRLAEAVRRAASAGAHVALHAIGRRAVSLALDAYEAAEGKRRGSAEFRIEHAEEIDAEIVARACRLGVVLSMQPNFTARWQGAGGLYIRAIGEERTRRLNPYRSVAARASLRFGSDTMPLDPFLGIRGALSHPDPGERLALPEALAAYSFGGMSAGCAGDRLAAENPASLVVLAVPGGDPERAFLEGTARVLWTVFEGRSVYTDTDDPPPDEILEATR